MYTYMHNEAWLVQDRKQGKKNSQHLLFIFQSSLFRKNYNGKNCWKLRITTEFHPQKLIIVARGEKELTILNSIVHDIDVVSAVPT